MRLNQNSRGRAIRIAALLALLALIGIHLVTRSRNSQNVAFAYPEIPQGGLADNDTDGKVPGDPNNAITDLQQFYKLAQTYRTRKGKYPTGGDLFVDIDQHPSAYGVSNLKDINDVFINPDDRFADSPEVRKRAGELCTYIYTDKRPNGTDVGASKLSDQRDVLGYTDAYFHKNLRTFKGERSTVNPVGYYLVLWDDGQVQSIPYDQVSFAPQGKGEFAQAFPGQAGVPANALNYDEYWRLSGWEKGPRGQEGGKGQSYNGKLPR